MIIRRAALLIPFSLSTCTSVEEWGISEVESGTPEVTVIVVSIIVMTA
jgi:hypothetical protein